MNSEIKQILDKVQKPGRYTGGEINSIRKTLTKNRTSVLLAYPDVYEVGMSYLGLRILYHLLNERDDIICERTFMPYEDMREQLKNSGQKLFSLESKTPINRFDIIGFSLSYELTYTNVLDMLHSGNITLMSEKRKEEEPLIIAGGGCCYNPEPMSSFIDAFIIGDGEESLLNFIDEYRILKKRTLSRQERIRFLSGVEGVYVPSLYETKYSGNKFLGLKPIDKDVPQIIKKVSVDDFENAYYPVKQIVPFVKIVHDRIAVEIMRGCPNKCRFCQAGAVNRPVRLRTPERIRSICCQTYKNTGYERIALLSLSSVNYPYLTELVSKLKKDFRDKGIGISIPSLRVDEAFYDLPEMMSTIRKTGLTFALEAASEDMRKSLAKEIDFQVLCKSALLAFRHGWQRLKLYFMVGFPGEAADETEKIVEMAKKLSELKKAVSPKAAEIKVSVNSFIPKAHTALQWLGMKGRGNLSDIQRKLVSSSSKKVKFEFHNLKQSLVEACLARGDRRVSDVIYTAWKRGARMDGWMEFFNFKTWEESFIKCGLNIYDCASRTYSFDDILPWAHIKIGMNEEHFKTELKASGLSAFAEVTPYPVESANK